MKKLLHKSPDLFGNNSDPAYLALLGKTTCKNIKDVKKQVTELQFCKEKKSAILKMAQSAYDRILENEKVSLGTLQSTIIKINEDLSAYFLLHPDQFKDNRMQLEDFEILLTHNFKVKSIKKGKEK